MRCAHFICHSCTDMEKYRLAEDNRHLRELLSAAAAVVKNSKTFDHGREDVEVLLANIADALQG